MRSHLVFFPSHRGSRIVFIGTAELQSLFRPCSLAFIADNQYFFVVQSTARKDIAMRVKPTRKKMAKARK